MEVYSILTCFVCAFVCACGLSLEGVNGSPLGMLGTNGQTQCLLMRVTCAENPTEVEKCKATGTECVGVTEIPIPQLTCDYACSEPRQIEVNITATTMPNLEGNGTAPTSEDNVTTPRTTSMTTTETTRSWRDDPAYCGPFYKCLNGGKCDPEYRQGIRTTPKCNCPSNFTGELCQWECSLQCDFNASCQVDTNGTNQFCTGPLEPVASLQPPEVEKVWFWPVIAGFIVLLVAILTYVVIIKLRGRSLLVTKIFHYFQPYEDDDGKEFDVFISYRSSNQDYSQSEDEQFVIRVLQPTLEKEMRCNVCVHYRDFQPGETIANNIMSAVENSRRTLLVLSPLYVESEWARMEYQKAHQEMYKLRHKIIPIIFRDLSQTSISDPTLKNILASVTYIEYPEDSSTAKEKERFWKMLQLALPKKRDSLDKAITTKSGSKKGVYTTEKYTPILNGHALVSQESCISNRTNMTDVPMTDSPKSNGLNGGVTLDINEIDQIQIFPDQGKQSTRGEKSQSNIFGNAVQPNLSDEEKKVKEEKLYESATTFTAVLDPRS